MHGRYFGICIGVLPAIGVFQMIENVLLFFLVMVAGVVTTAAVFFAVIAVTEDKK